jgi:hypothetical protein
VGSAGVLEQKYSQLNRRQDNKVSTAIATQGEGQEYAAIIERVLATGDLAKLSSQDRINYYNAVCRSVGLNPLTQPFQYITLNGKLTLYTRRDATDQLRKIHNVSIQIVSREHINDVYIVTARATTKEGRADESIGAVAIGRLQGDLLCNAIMKAETKAKRRVTLSVCGLGFLDESEIETIPDVVLHDEPSQPALEAAPETKPNGNGREKLIKTVSDLDSLIRELRGYGISNANIQARMKEVAGVDKRADLKEGQMLDCIEDFGSWANELHAAKHEGSGK